MDNKPNENLIFTIQELRLKSNTEKIYVQNIESQIFCLQLEVSKNQYKNIYFEMKVDYSIAANEKSESIRLKRIKIANIDKTLEDELRKEKENKTTKNIKFIKLLQKDAGKRFNYWIPVRFMAKIYYPDCNIAITEDVTKTDHYRKAFFREMMLKIDLMGYNFEEMEITLFDLDSLSPEPIHSNGNSKSILVIDNIFKQSKDLFDEISKEIGYYTIAQKGVEYGYKFLSNLFKINKKQKDVKNKKKHEEEKSL